MNEINKSPLPADGADDRMGHEIRVAETPGTKRGGMRLVSGMLIGFAG